MKRLLGLLVVAGTVAVCAMLSTNNTQAADHTDPPAVSGNSAADINDVYSWIDGDALALALTVEPGAGAGATLSNAVQYAFHVNRGAGDTEVICQYDAGVTTCFVGTAASFMAVQGDASGATGFTDTATGVSVFAAVRNDSFFFNLDGLLATEEFVRGAGLLASLAGACPDLSGGPVADAASTGEAVVNCLTTTCDVGPGDNGNAAAADTFLGQNVVTLVVRVPLTMLAGDGDLLKVWSSTHNR